MIGFNFLKECTGCSVCVDGCPQNCIRMVKSSYGYLIPSIDASLCIKCGQCDRVCPTLNTKHVEYGGRVMFSAYHKSQSIRKEGSSGSVFYALASKVIDNGGIVVGAAFDERLKLKHQVAVNLDELKPLLKSKYLQSNTSGIYIKIKNYLKGGKNVLFCGTPCQCNAVKNYIPENLSKKLILVDFICHGVPSQDNFDKSMSLLEKEKKKKIISYSFRQKIGVDVHGYEITYNDSSGKHLKECGSWTQQPFYRGFKSYIAFRQSCYHCKHVGVNRSSDITLADFWGLPIIDKTVKDFGKGYSMVIINSDKGKQIFSDIKEVLCIKTFDLIDAITYNSSYTKCVDDSLVSKAYRFCYKNFPYSVVEPLFFSKTYNILLRIKGKFRYITQLSQAPFRSALR